MENINPGNWAVSSALRIGASSDTCPRHLIATICKVNETPRALVDSLLTTPFVVFKYDFSI